MSDVFISHAETDKAFVLRLAKDLRQQGLSVWVDEYLKPGEDWASAIDNAIDKSRNVLVVLSENSVKSEWVRSEAALALTKGEKRVVPIFSEKDVEVPFMLRSIQGVDLSEPASYEASVKRLAGQLRESEKPLEGEVLTAHEARFRLAMLERLTLEQESILFEAVAKAQTRRFVATTLSISIIGVLSGIVAVTLSVGSVPSWATPVIYGLIGAALGIAGTFGVTFLTRLFKRRFERDVEADR